MIVLQCIQIPNALYLRCDTVLLLDFIKFLSCWLTIPLITVCICIGISSLFWDFSCTPAVFFRTLHLKRNIYLAFKDWFLPQPQLCGLTDRFLTFQLLHVLAVSGRQLSQIVYTIPFQLFLPVCYTTFMNCKIYSLAALCKLFLCCILNS